MHKQFQLFFWRMSSFKTIRNTGAALAINLLWVYLAFTLCRLIFIGCNTTLYVGHLDTAYLFRLLVAGLRFDTTAILYLNCWLIVGYLLPLHFKEMSTLYYKVLRVLFVAINFIGIGANLCDCAYFPYTGRRTTWNVLQEFSGEGGNFVNIIVHEALPYWYLFIVAIVLVWGLWKGFRIPEIGRISGVKPLIRYYLRQLILLIVAVVLTIGGMRGGFTTAIRPITLSNANQYVDHAIDAGIVLNTPFSIMRTIGKKPFRDVNYLPEEEATQLYSPLHLPADSTVFEPHNVVILILESFGKQAMARGYMPFVASLAQQGHSFEYSFASGRKSIDGMPSVLSSIPSFVEPFFLTPAAMNELSGIAGELSRKKGYHSAFFHGAENGSMGFQAFSHATGFQEYYGRTEYNQDSRYHGDDDFDGTWAIWDEEFLQFMADKMCEFKEPFCTSVFTASSHPPFAIPARYEGKYPKTDPAIFGSIQYSDDAVRLFFEKAEQQPWYNNTVFVITADHTSSAVDAEYLTDLGMYKVPIIFYAPGLPELFGDMPCGVNESLIASQTDIMPSLLGLLGYDMPYVAFGQDLFHSQPAETFAINYLPGNGYYQFVQGDWMLQFDGEEVAHAYRYKDDSLLTDDKHGQHPLEYEKRLKSIIQQYMWRMNHNALIAK